MKRIAISLVLFALSGGLSAQNISGPANIAVQGQARIQVIPDIFPLEVTLEETSLNQAATQKKIEGLAQQVVDLAEKMRIPDNDITVGNLSIDTEEDWDDETDERVFKGNTYQRIIKVRFHALADLKSFVDSLPTGKEVRLETGTFSYSKSEEEKKKLLEQAIANARATAEQMASRINSRIIGVHTVSDRAMTDSYVGRNTDLNAIGVAGAAVHDGPRVNVVLKAGVITIEQSVYIIYLLGN